MGRKPGQTAEEYIAELEQELEESKRILFESLRDQIKIREDYEKQLEYLSVENDKKQRKVEYYEGTYFTIETAAKERMEIIQEQQKQIEKYRKESIYRPLRKLKSLLNRG